MTLLSAIDKKLKEKTRFEPYLAHAEKLTGLKRLHIFLGLSGIWALYMVFGYFAQLVCNLIGIWYPARCSLNIVHKKLVAAETTSKEDDTKWLIYWIVFASFNLVEFFLELILTIFPFYWLLKALFLLWCIAPGPNNGTKVLYHGIIKPLYRRSPGATMGSAASSMGSYFKFGGK